MDRTRRTIDAPDRRTDTKTPSKLSVAAPGLVAVLVVAAAVLLAYKGHARAHEPYIPPGAHLASWRDNGRDGRYVLQIAQGPALDAGEPVAGIVSSDTDCEADDRGLSHCGNTLELPGGARVVVIDTHQMSRYRCLSPGDRISLSAISPGWVLGSLAG